MSKSVLSLAVFGGFCLLSVTSNAHADCDNSTLNGRYAFRSEASPTTGGRRLNLSLLEFHGDGTYDNLGFTVNTDGTITTGTLSARYQIIAAATFSIPTVRYKGLLLLRRTVVSFTSSERLRPS